MLAMNDDLVGADGSRGDSWHKLIEFLTSDSRDYVCLHGVPSIGKTYLVDAAVRKRKSVERTEHFPTTSYRRLNGAGLLESFQEIFGREIEDEPLLSNFPMGDILRRVVRFVERRYRGVPKIVIGLQISGYDKERVEGLSEALFSGQSRKIIKWVFERRRDLGDFRWKGKPFLPRRLDVYGLDRGEALAFIRDRIRRGVLRDGTPMEDVGSMVSMVIYRYCGRHPGLLRSFCDFLCKDGERFDLAAWEGKTSSDGALEAWVTGVASWNDETLRGELEEILAEVLDKTREYLEHAASGRPTGLASLEYLDRAGLTVDGALPGILALLRTKSKARGASPRRESASPSPINITITVETKMENNSTRDKYHIEDSQIGIVGPGGHAHDMEFKQLWGSLAKDTALDGLVIELSQLLSALRSEPSSGEHEAAIAEVAAAQMAASEGQGAEVLRHLRSAGTWTWDVATKIGVTVAAATLKAALGI